MNPHITYLDTDETTWAGAREQQELVHERTLVRFVGSETYSAEIDAGLAQVELYGYRTQKGRPIEQAVYCLGTHIEYRAGDPLPAHEHVARATEIAVQNRLPRCASH